MTLTTLMNISTFNRTIGCNEQTALTSLSEKCQMIHKSNLRFSKLKFSDAISNKMTLKSLSVKLIVVALCRL